MFYLLSKHVYFGLKAVYVVRINFINVITLNVSKQTEDIQTDILQKLSYQCDFFEFLETNRKYPNSHVTKTLITAQVFQKS